MEKIFAVTATALLVAGNAIADEKPKWEQAAEDLKWMSSIAGCETKKANELLLCINQLRVYIAEECIINANENSCDQFRMMTESEGLKSLKLAALVSEETQ